MAKRKKVNVETIKLKKKVATPFVKGNIIIPAGFKMSRAKFDKMFKGKITHDFESLWREYQDHIN